MAFAQVLSSNTSFVGSNNVNHSVTLPPVVGAGNLLLILAAVNGNPTITAPAGWTPIADTNAGGSNKKELILAKSADGTEGGTTVTFTTDAGEQSAHVSLAIGNWSGNLSFIATSGIPVNANGATPNPPAVTAPWGSEDNLFIAGGFLREGSTIDSYPTGYTSNQLSATTSTGSAGSTMVIATRELAAASDDPDSFGITGMFNATPAHITDSIVIRGPIANIDPQLDTPNQDYSIETGTTGSIDLGSGFSDANNDALLFAITPDINQVQGFTFNAFTGVITYDGTQQVAAPISYTITADDNQGGTPASDSVLIEVTPPLLVIDSVSNSTPESGSQITITFSNAQGAITAGDFNVASQTSAQAVIDIPDPGVFVLSGETFPTLPFEANVNIPVSDGVATVNVTVQIQPKTGEQHATIGAPDASGAYANDGSVTGLKVHTKNNNNIVFDPVTGLGASTSAGGSIEYAVYDGEWSDYATYTIQPFSANLVTIQSIVTTRTTATATFTYPDSDVTSFEYSLDGGAWSAATSPLSITGLTEDTIYQLSIRPLLNGSAGAATTQNFVTNPAVDTSPDPLPNESVSNVALNDYVLFTPFTVVGVDPGVDVPLSIVNGEYSFSSDGGVTWSAFGSATSNVRLNYQIQPRHLSSADYEGSVTTTIDLGGVAGTFTSTTVADTDAPVITLTRGNITHIEGDPWVEPGYTATDNVDGDITANVVITGSVDVNTSGNYTLTYTVSDSSNNSTSVTRNVTVQAQVIDPVIVNDLIPRLLSTDIHEVSLFKGRGNRFRVALSHNGVPLDLSIFTRFELYGLTTNPLDSSVVNAIDWDDGLGVINVDAGDLATASGSVDTTLIGYSTEYPSGAVLWHPSLAQSHITVNIVDA